MSLQVGYVIKRGTCKACKDEGNESLIQQGDVYWTKGMGQYAKKYHFACFVPKFGSWKYEPVLQSCPANAVTGRRTETACST